MEEPIQTRPYLKLLLLATLLGLISAVITFTFITLVDGAASAVWETAAEAIGLSLPVFTLLVCTLGGLLVGVLVKVFGDHTGIFAEMVATMKAPIFSALFVLLLVQSSAGPVIAIAVVVGLLATTRLSLVTSQPAPS